jgi:tetratricopeptide (TPR) repeat protein
MLSLLAALAGVLAYNAPPLQAAHTPVRAWETNAIIPTYLAAPPSAIPRFYSGRTYQGAKATFYPYPVQDKLTDIKTNQTYRLVYLENDYLQISVMPEIGGRIFSAVDKSNGYNFFYRQRVIKPALIGMLGAWISGGVEWNIPHHHRASSFMPVEYTMTTNADGSATVWVGETELRHRLRWLVGMTLYPDRGYLELNCKVFNSTPFAHSMLFWINPAVHANTNYQVLFPPSTEWVTQHSKPEFASWPIARQWYGGVDYTAGVDISWWKNHPSPVSFFAWNYEDDWFGGYDHGQQAGVLHVADHHLAPGKKFFEWGNGPEGEMWSQVLTDEDGPYLELMAGAWSDNQPDYSWMQPGEVREWQHWWYPIRQMGGVKTATKDLALNLEIADGQIRLALNATRNFPRLHVSLKAKPSEERGTTPFYGTNIALYVGQAWKTALPLNQFFILPESLSVEIFELNDLGQFGSLVASYQEKPPKNTPMPKPVERPRNPKDYSSVDELYYTAQRIEQLYSPSFEPEPYYQEILRRDPGDYRANTAMGILLCRQWRWSEAENYLRAALARATAHYIRPKDGEASYYLGVALLNQAREIHRTLLAPPSPKQASLLAAAETAFRQAAWSEGWKAASYLQLAEIAGQRGQYQEALQWLNAHLTLNPRHAAAHAAKASILNFLGHWTEALAAATQALHLDPLSSHAELEHYLAQNRRRSVLACVSREEMATVKQIFQSSAAEALEVVAFYQRAGLPHGSLGRCLIYGKPAWAAPFVPLSFYYCALQSPDVWQFQDFDFAASASRLLTGAFLFQHESIPLLTWRADQAPSDPMPLYALGNLLYDSQPARAIAAWENARQRLQAAQSANPALHALVLRNLGTAYAQQHKAMDKAVAHMEQAVRLNPREPRFLYELDVLLEASGAPVKQRLNWLEQTPEIAAQRDDSLTRLILLCLADGQYDRALDILTTHRFHNWEGSSEIRNVYVEARLLRGRRHLQEGRTAEALKDFSAAQEFPANLEVGRPKRDAKAAAIYYHLALAHQAAGQTEAARQARTQAAAAYDGGQGSDSRFYRAMALKELGREAEAQPLFEGLVRHGQELQTREPADYFAKFGERRSERVRKADAHYLTGLGRLGLGQTAEAQAEFQKALELHPSHLGAAMHRR